MVRDVSIGIVGVLALVTGARLIGVLRNGFVITRVSVVMLVVTVLLVIGCRKCVWDGGVVLVLMCVVIRVVKFLLIGVICLLCRYVLISVQCDMVVSRVVLDLSWCVRKCVLLCLSLLLI